AACARHITFEGNRGSAGGGSITLANREATVVRRIPAGRLRRSDRPDPQRMVQRSFTSTTAQSSRVSEFFFCRQIATGRGSACSHIILLPDRNDAFQPRPGVEGNTGRFGEGPESTSRRDGTHRFIR